MNPASFRRHSLRSRPNGSIRKPAGARRSGGESARVYESLRDQILDGVLAAGSHLSQQTIAIADAVFRGDDPRRSQSRADAATLLVAERRPAEAEPLVLEAIGLRKAMTAGNRDGLTQLLEQIQAMKKAR